MNRPRLRSMKLAFALGLLAVAAWAGRGHAQYGAILSGTGPVNRSFAGVATAAPLSPAGALYWNPATLAGFKQSELEAGAELLMPFTTATSSIPANGFGPGVPPAAASGRQSTDSTVFALPTIGLAYVPDDSDFYFGFGAFAAAGFGVDYAGSNVNPLLTAPPPNGIGFGPVYSEFQVLQIIPAVAYRVNERLSLSAAPILDVATLRVDPGLFAAPDDANRDGFFTYPRASHGRTVLGAGFMLGVFYQADVWAVGASVKSPQWLNSFRFNSTDELNRPRQLHFDLDLPMIVSVGAAYTGFEDWVLGLDVRYLDYANADGFGDKGFRPDGSVRGLGWRSVFTVAAAAQYQVSEDLSLRGGYAWGENPIPDGQAFINTVAPTIFEHHVYAGASWHVSEGITLSLAYAHAFENAISGPVVTPAGAVPGTSARLTTRGETVLLGATFRLGGCRAMPCQAQAEGPRQVW